MKQISIILFLFTSNSVYSQSSNYLSNLIKDQSYKISKIEKQFPVSVVSKNKDTLWLADNELGRTIGRAWKVAPLLNTILTPPKIIYVKNIKKIKR